MYNLEFETVIETVKIKTTFKIILTVLKVSTMKYTVYLFINGKCQFTMCTCRGYELTLNITITCNLV